VDVRLTGDPAGLLDRLQQAGRRDLGDFLFLLVQPDPDTPVIEGDGMVYGGHRFRVEARLAGRLYGAPFGFGVGFGDPLATAPVGSGNSDP
jgi:hypothetical protein